MTDSLTPLSFGRTVGNLTVYDEQYKCACSIYEIFKRHGGPPLLIAQMQQGKTGTAIIVIEHFIKNCKLENRKYEIIYLTNISDNVLKDQTDERLMESGYSNNVKILHHADLQEGRFDPDMTVDVRLIVIDECQVALGKHRPFHKFLKKLGIRYGESIDSWTNKENYVLSISATPYAQVIKSKLDSKSFESVVLPVSSDYYSLQHLYSGGRLHQSAPVVERGRITTFFIDRMKEFMESCKSNENCGSMIVRAKGKSPEILKQYVEQNFPDVTTRIFEASPVNNIASLDRLLSKNLPGPFVAIIRGSLRAGKTLTTTKHIRMWIEPPTSKTDTMCQVVGRCVGFEMVDKINRRFDDTFPIYCNIREIDTALEFFNHYNCIPSGINNKTTVEVEKFEVELYDYDYVRKELERVGGKIDELPEDLKFWDEKQNPPEYMPKRVGTVTGNKEKNLCQFVLNKQGNWSKGNIIHIDGEPTVAEFVADYEKLKTLYGNVSGKYVRFKPMVAPILKNDYEGKLNKDCMFRERKR